jgi:hypothetical protein
MAWLQLTLSDGTKALVNTDGVLRMEEGQLSKGSVIVSEDGKSFAVVETMDEILRRLKLAGEEIG